MYNSSLYKKYQKVCNAYLQTFCKKHDFYYDDSCWVANRVGEIAIIGDFFVSMETIITDIEENVHKDEFLKWYDWSLEDGNNWNYLTWLRNKNQSLLDNEKRLHELSEKIQEFKSYLDENCPYKDECPF